MGLRPFSPPKRLLPSFLRPAALRAAGFPTKTAPPSIPTARAAPGSGCRCFPGPQWKEREVIIASKAYTQTRKPITLDMDLLVCPHAALAENLSRTFGLEPVDTVGIRESTEEHLAPTTKGLPLTDKALELHLQRVEGAFVSSAFGAGQFYSQKVSQAKDLTAKVANEDRSGISRF
jgi:hypothetical protein